MLVAEDNADLAFGVCELLRTEADIDVVGVVGDAASLFESVRTLDAHVVILDLNLAGGSSVPAMQSVRRERPHTGIVVYSGYDRADLESCIARARRLRVRLEERRRHGPDRGRAPDGT